jgi:peptidyl-prolyl cis-trans isomerase B (cyclophilin B)
MMKISLLVLLVYISCFVPAGSKEINQITGNDNPHYLITVTHGGRPMGSIEIELFPDVAPRHCHNFDSLVAIKFYDSTAFHRVIPGFMIQGGDPNSKNKPRNTWGYGDPSQTTVPAEFSTLSHTRGIMSAARANDINSATSQFFICIGSPTYLDGKYSIYGQVVIGMDVADSIVNSPRDASDNPIEKVEMMVKKLDPSSVKDASQDNNGIIMIYPNPASDVIRFKSELNNLQISSVRINDLSGKSCFAQTYNTAVSISELSLPVSNLIYGVYTIELLDASGKEYKLRAVIE